MISIKERARAFRLKTEELLSVFPEGECFIATSAGVIAHVPLSVAAERIVLGTATLATAEQITGYQEGQAAARAKVLAAEDARSTKPTIYYREQS